ncbi:hypothetical protein SAMN04488543_2002 [Friedmanniella luteola]|uniref:PAP2 superfamily protein n=1 Tax=Friedmanniella luteola TaxID=546871 RepID=A0A1H1TEH3_9ACTN|nr:vanadium-dependent haloperoxidase [Friedmanniella luteola]SDS58356.1 hypothetical protein SAMN04488543_2002 [Friedmanniella luteola]
MSHQRRTRALLSAVLALLLVGFLAQPTVGAPPSRRGVQVVLDWERIGIRTVYTDAASPIPSGTLYLGLMSLAVDRAVRAASGRHRTSAPAAAAVAAHDVLRTYFPASAARLDDDLAGTLAEVGRGRSTRNGVRLGHAVAARLVASRVGDGIPAAGEQPLTYRRDVAPGVWQPPAAGMLVPWLGYVEPLVLRRPVPVDGPDALGSAAYAADYAEVRRVGRATAAATDRSSEQTAIATFFNSNVVLLYHEALIRHLEASPLSLTRTAHLFAAIDAASADAAIRCWQLKYEFGFWRPFQAVAGAADDGNPATTAESGWTPLLATPPYPDYVSGHGCLTSAFAGATRALLGGAVPLRLHSATTNSDRSYPTLSALEEHALQARIWSGLHFRDAMEDAYRVGHVTAERVVAQLG